jgi:hypothetical protein
MQYIAMPNLLNNYNESNYFLLSAKIKHPAGPKPNANLARFAEEHTPIHIYQLVLP